MMDCERCGKLIPPEDFEGIGALRLGAILCQDCDGNDLDVIESLKTDAITKAKIREILERTYPEPGFVTPKGCTDE